MSALYLYCFSTPQEANFFKQLALPVTADALPSSSIFTLEHAGLVAVYGLVDAADYVEENLTSIAWLEPRAYQHAAIVQKIMLAAPVLPVKFATLFDSLDSLQKVLTTHSVEIAKHLDVLLNKCEWAVKVFLKEDIAKRQLSSLDAEIADFMLAMPVSPGARYLQQKKLDDILASKLRLWIDSQVKKFCDVLTPHTHASAALRLLSAKASGRSERMVFNSSYLIAQDCLSAFRSQISSLSSSALVDGFVIELSGPWPAYNFCPDLRAL